MQGSNGDRDAGTVDGPATGRKVIIRSFAFSDLIAYIEHVEPPLLQSKFTEKLAVSHVNPVDAQRLGRLVHENGLHLVVFSAAWCKDCQEVIPTLAKVNQIAAMPVKVLGGAKVNLQQPPQWHSPPTPPEFNELDIKKIPAILVIGKERRELARFYERPPPGKTLELHLLETVTNATAVK